MKHVDQLAGQRTEEEAKEQVPGPTEFTSALDSEIKNGPRHVAIIMDGNGRWAKQRGLPRVAATGGTENIRRIIETFADCQVKYLTLYAFSTENWGRPQTEVQSLMRILGEVIDRETQNLHQNGVRLRHIGQIEGLSKKLQKAVLKAVDLTKDNTRISVNIAFNYGGRAEILEAVKRIIREGLPAEAIDEATFGSYLYTAGVPDPDLIIRTAGEMRLSNYLIWQAAYSEYYSTPTYWPDFGKEEILRALTTYCQRERRFGGIEARTS